MTKLANPTGVNDSNNIMMDSEIDRILKVAKKNIQRDGQLSPVALFEGYMPRFSFYPISYESQKQKTECFTKVGVLAGLMGAKRVVLIMECIFRSLIGDKKAQQYTAENYSTEMPSTYPPSMRQEGIVLQILQFKTEEKTIYLIPFEKKEKNIVFKKPIVLEGVGGDIQELVFKGYKINTRREKD